MNENQQRDQIVRLAKSMFERGLTFGSSGNISARVDDGWLMTPTGSTMGTLDPAKISKLDNDGEHISGDKPTKESFLHQVMYEKRPGTGAVVHLHSTHSVAVSCLSDINKKNVLPPITAYYVMKIGTLPLIPYFPPGDLDLAKAVREMASDHHALLLANHGPVVAGKSLEDAVYAMEELEETAKLFLMLKNMNTSFLDDAQINDLKSRFPT
ncbi:MAG: aldolase [Rhodospirillales bacterium]|jgi:ribulose-5-phosphate 4-epimerase/fuculose-1-phosphate aldolase|tara:strand:- start:113 stop:745 length:633 start_codon:yes stop_codon:yes gene_type:complete